MNTRTARLALAGLAAAATTAMAQPTILIEADVTNAHFGATITWTVSVAGLNAGEYVQAYDFNLVASEDTGTASPFATALTPLVNPTPGTPSGASILGASGGQSTILNPLGTQFGNVVLGTFTVEWDANGILSYTLTDGGNLNAPIVRVRSGSDFGPIVYEGDDFTVLSDSVFIPAPATAWLLFGAIPLVRRRR